jgi:rRNA pseudouridine-1189 N-methylase Emg1 (Nep1/Mra1 family)
VDLQDDDNLEENREPPPEVKPLINILPGVFATLLTRVFERKLKATELIRFKEKSVTELDQEDRVFKMTESGDTVGFRKAAASLKDWGPNPQI